MDRIPSPDDEKLSFLMVFNARLCPKEDMERCISAIINLSTPEERDRLIEKVGSTYLSIAAERLLKYLEDNERFEECSRIQSFQQSI